MKEKKKKEQKPSIERFDKLSGICEIEGRFYVFCDYVEDDIFNELGSVIGEGKTKEKALIDAVKILNKKLLFIAKKIEYLQDTNNFDPYESWYGKGEDHAKRLGLFNGKAEFVDECSEQFQVIDEYEEKLKKVKLCT